MGLLNLQYDISYAIAGAVVTLIILAYVRTRRVVTGTDSAFRSVVLSALGCSVTDAASAVTLALGEYIPDWINMVIFSSVFIFASAMSAYFAVYLLEHVKHMTGKAVPNIYRRPVGIVCLLFLIAMILNLRFGFLFRITGSDYIKESLYFIVVIVPYAIGFYIVCLFVKFGNLFERSHRASIVMFFVAFGGGAVLQFTLFPSVLLVDFTAAVALLPVLFTMETPDFAALTEAMQQLEVEKHNAELANKTKSEFLASMSHEIRTPINAVLGMNEMILRETESSSIRYYSNNIKNSGTALLAIINDILDISKIESGRQEIVETEYLLSELVRDSIVQIADRAETKNLSVDVEMDETLPQKLYGDVVHIRQSIINLLTNAVKYTERGYVKFIISGTVNGDIVDIKFGVKDTGRGISEDEIGHIFEKFTRADVKNNITIEGTGLGLSLVKSMVELLGGTVEAKSMLGVGSLFEISLSQKVVDFAPVGKVELTVTPGESHYEKKLDGHGKSILVVDDVAINVKIVQLLLKECGLFIDTAFSGQEAVDKATKNYYHVVLMDHMMPGMDGIEAMKLIKSNPEAQSANSVFIMLTANALNGMKEQFMADGFDAFLAKPIHGALLEETLANYIG